MLCLQKKLQKRKKMENKRRLQARIAAYTVFALLLLFGSGCNVTRHITEENPLYVGMKKTKITNRDDSYHGEVTLAAVEGAIKAKPNNSFFGGTKTSPIIPPIGLWIHDRLQDDSTKVGRWFYRKFATKPILINAVNPANRAKVGTGILRENGYFRGSVRAEVLPSKDPLKVFAHYRIDMGPVFTYDSVSPLSSDIFQDSTVHESLKFTKLRKGRYFSLSELLEERQLISMKMRDSGYYYFQPDAISYQADTLNAPAGKILLRPSFATGYPARVFRPWQIENISVQMLGPNGEAPTDSITIEGMELHYWGQGKKRRPLVRPRVLRRRILFGPGSKYSQRAEMYTRSSLAQLGAFSTIDFSFRPVRRGASDTLPPMPGEMGQLDFRLLTMPDKPWDVSLEASVKSKSNNFLGPALAFTLGKRNVFGGGESLAFDISGSYEWQTGRRPEGARAIDINSYEITSSVNLDFPSLMFPWLATKSYFFPVKSSFQLSASMLNRAGFFRMFSFGFSSAYELQPNVRHTHVVRPLAINYNYLQRRTEALDLILQANPMLALSLSSQLIPQLGYTYTYNNYFDTRRRQQFWMEYSISESGNIINGIYAAAGRPYNETKNILGAPFAQFVKATAEWRYTYTIDRYQTLAVRLGLGAIFSFGNMHVAPYNEQFYVGGANSVRAFTVRSIGPGRYVPDRNNRYAFIDQTGDFKLEANIEYRVKLVGDLGAAIFLDSGNVWLLRKDERRPGGALEEVKSAKDFVDQLALGTGIGLRYDLGFLVIRLDCGIGLHLPYETGKKGYYNISKFSDALGIHLAVGYPF